MNRLMTTAATLLIAAVAAPAMAQAALPPPPPPGDMAGHGQRVVMIRHGDGDHGGMMGGPMGGMGPMGGTLAGLTPEGRKILGDAMRDFRAEGRDDVGNARDRMLSLLEADRLDVAALRRAMGDEHAAAERQQQRHQEAMLSAFQKLSPRDRKAFAVSMRNQHFRMEQMRKDVDARMKTMRDHWRNGPKPDFDADPDRACRTTLEPDQLAR